MTKKQPKHGEKKTVKELKVYGCLLLRMLTDYLLKRSNIRSWLVYPTQVFIILGIVMGDFLSKLFIDVEEIPNTWYGMVDMIMESYN